MFAPDNPNNKMRFISSNEHQFAVRDMNISICFDEKLLCIELICVRLHRFTKLSCKKKKTEGVCEIFHFDYVLKIEN